VEGEELERAVTFISFVPVRELAQASNLAVQSITIQTFERPVCYVEVPALVPLPVR